jgi:hypothetical protein
MAFDEMEEDLDLLMKRPWETGLEIGPGMVQDIDVSRDPGNPTLSRASIQ